jgi:4-hydroxy-3-methylbut-2-en-1-yl diphosphate reductase
MKILRASNLGMCFGVRDAIALALARSRAQPLSILGELVHNETVLGRLRAEGIRMETEAAKLSTSAVMITAHGASDSAINGLRERGLSVIEATCPLVHVAHRAIQKLAADGFHPVVIGRRGHVEVRGMTEDLPAHDVVLSEAEIRALQPRARFGVVAQTTQPIDRVRELVACLRDHFAGSDVRFIDTVCQPTKQRQTAAVELARQCDVVIVIGGAHSNNTRELVATCERNCRRVHHIQDASELRSTWFHEHDTIGITAGTSTPDETIQSVEHWLNEFAEFQTKLADYMAGHSAQTGV